MKTVLARVRSVTVLGIEARPVEIEIDLGLGLAQTIIVGLPDKAVRESRDRVRAALRNCGFDYPRSGRLTLNLAPASLRKEGPMYDLPIAVGILCATAQMVTDRLADCCVVGELALDGRIRPVRGVLSIAGDCSARGVGTLIVPHDNGREAALVAGLTVVPARTLIDVVRFLAGDLSAEDLPVQPRLPVGSPAALDYEDVIGQPQAKVALQVAAAGRHHVLMCGPPGVGKSMLAARMPSIMGPLPEAAALETTRIYSVAGLPGDRDGLIERPPFRAPHHTISSAGLIGGGSPLRPGEISLAHNGVLFLDEAPEFNRRALESLRQPIEQGRVDLVRVGGRTVYPAAFQLLMAMNPCPCGYLTSASGRCRCTPGAVDRYRRRLSGPLLDRIDLQVELGPVDPAQLAGGPDRDGDSATLSAGVTRARRAQADRYGPGVANATVPDGILFDTCRLSRAAQTCLEASARDRELSARSYVRTVRVARTIADIAASASIEPTHVLQALMLRRPAG